MVLQWLSHDAEQKLFHDTELDLRRIRIKQLITQFIRFRTPKRVQGYDLVVHLGCRNGKEGEQAAWFKMYPHDINLTGRIDNDIFRLRSR